MSIFDRILDKAFASKDKDKEKVTPQQQAKIDEMHARLRMGEHVDRNMYMPPKDTRHRSPEQLRQAQAYFDAQSEMPKINPQPLVEHARSAEMMRQEVYGNGNGNRYHLSRPKDLSGGCPDDVFQSCAYLPNVLMNDLRPYGNTGKEVLFPVVIPEYAGDDMKGKIGWVRAESDDVYPNGDGTCDIVMDRPAYQIRGVDNNGRRFQVMHSLPGGVIESAYDAYCDTVRHMPVLRIDKGDVRRDLPFNQSGKDYFVGFDYSQGIADGQHSDGAGYIRFSPDEVKDIPFYEGYVVTMQRPFYGVKYEDTPGHWKNTAGFDPGVVRDAIISGKPANYAQMATETRAKLHPEAFVMEDDRQMQ